MPTNKKSSKPLSEKEIERRTCRFAESQGMLQFKFTSPGIRGVPDRIFMYRQKTFFIEFKAPGETPTKLQQHMGEKITQQEIGYFWADSLERGKEIISGAKKAIDDFHTLFQEMSTIYAEVVQTAQAVGEKMSEGGIIIPSNENTPKDFTKH